MASQEVLNEDGHAFLMTLPNTAAAASHARKRFIGFLQHVGLGADLLADIETVIGEALANSAEHGYSRHGTIRIEALFTDGYLEASVSDDGPGFFLRGPIPAHHPPAHSPRGYGLFLIRTFVDELEFRNGGQTVWFRKRFRPAGSSNKQ